MAKFTGHTSAIAQDTAGVCARIPFYYLNSAGVTTTIFTAEIVRKQFNFVYITIPTLPAGVDYVVPTFECTTPSASIGATMFAKLVNFGVMAGTTWTGTGATMGTVVEGGATNNVAGPVLCVVETGLGATGGNLTVTYVDQDGNTAEAGTAQALTNSALKGTAGYYSLNAPDWGARSVSTVTRSAGTGNVRLYGVYPLAVHGINAASTMLSTRSPMTEVGQFSKLVAGDKIAIINGGSTASAFIGMIHFIGFSNS